MILTRTERQRSYSQAAVADFPDQTLASIVHELNNPLTTILGLSELLVDETRLTGAPDKRVAKIRAEAERSVRIIRNVLDLCQASADPLRGGTREGRVLVDLNEAIRHSTALVEDQLERHRIALTVELPWRAPKVLSRPGELTQVFLNLVTNAIQAIAVKRGPGAITILGTQLGKRVCVTVEDDGPGFAEQDFERLFEPFFTTKSQGTGLGLSLSRRIIRGVGGDLWASRTPERGAIFTLELPIEECPSDLQDNPEMPGRSLKSDLSVLVVDAEGLIVNLVRDVLESKGFKIDSTTQGEVGLKMLGNRDYDLLICDYHMPGVAVGEFLKWIHDSGKNTRVLVLSGEAIQGDTRQFIEKHQSCLLAKPFTIDGLLSAVDRLLIV